MKKSNGPKKFIIAVLIIVVLAALATCVDFYLKVKTPYAGYENSVSVIVPKGASVASIGRLLYQAKVIPNYYYFRIYYQLFYIGSSFKTGEYLFDQPMTMKEIITKLHEGKTLLYKITVREGLSIPEIADIVAQVKQVNISQQDFIKHSQDKQLIQSIDSKATDLEGYLFPETYLVKRDTKAEELVQMMVERFKDNFTQVMAVKAKEINMTVREVITLASLIEKETASREERFLISSVFHNRLRIGMSLDCDPTFIYALKKDNQYIGRIRWKDLKYDSPYNTRLYRGLPPGPICSPGFASIEAALNPQHTKYLYFVAKNPGEHYFSESLEEHNRAVRQYIINKPRAPKE